MLKVTKETWSVRKFRKYQVAVEKCLEKYITLKSLDLLLLRRSLERRKVSLSISQQQRSQVYVRLKIIRA